MRRLAILAALLLTANISLAQDAEELRALLDQYLTLFSNEQSRVIAEEIMATPAIFWDRALLTHADTEMLFDELFADIKGRGWTRSVSLSVHVCELGQGLALMTLNYSALREDGEAIPPRVRGAFFLLRKLEAEWRIVAIYGRDPEVTVSCR